MKKLFTLSIAVAALAVWSAQAEDGKAIFDGDVEELVATKDDYIREYIS